MGMQYGELLEDSIRDLKSTIKYAKKYESKNPQDYIKRDKAVLGYKEMLKYYEAIQNIIIELKIEDVQTSIGNGWQDRGCVSIWNTNPNDQTL